MYMDKCRKIKRILAVLLVAFIMIGMLSVPTQAASKKNGLAKVSITKVSRQVSQYATGVIYTVKWKKVKGAKGYQVWLSSREAGEWYTTTSFTSKCSFKTGGSSIDTYKIKVRAYKVVKGKKKYGAWSKVKTIKVF